jgi:hypothetical protein
VGWRRSAALHRRWRPKRDELRFATSRVAVGGRALLGSSTGLAAYPLVQLLHAATPATAPPLLQLALCLTRTSPELLVTPAPAPQLHRTVSDTNS